MRKKPLALKDITVRVVKAAYKQTGLKPALWGDYVAEDGERASGCACALEALAKAKGFPHWAEVLERDESRSFAAGFDGVPFDPELHPEVKSRRAWALGRRIARAVGL